MSFRQLDKDRNMVKEAKAYKNIFDEVIPRYQHFLYIYF